MALTYPRFIHAQVLMHRLFSRNAASNRARPVRATLRAVRESEWVPSWRYRAEKGMQPSTAAVSDADAAEATGVWQAAKEAACTAAARLDELGIAKELVNRLLEPFQTVDVVMTGDWVAWESFLFLRDHPDAQHEILPRHYCRGLIEAGEFVMPITLTRA
ncbi:MAG: FAD-dependent thymidylate synthase, partial [Geminicoccaceae bacterium]|nr:FAD-dependent thymidylate synthase [Geminicoccaceae bacterium]